MLTPNQIEHYQSQGFLVLNKVLTPQEVAPLKTAAERIIDEFDVDQHQTVFSAKVGGKNDSQFFLESAQQISCFLEADALDDEGNLRHPKNESINKIGHALHDLVPEVKTFCGLPLFKEILSDLTVASPELWQTMYILKPPRIGGEVRWHQDATYLISEPSSVMGIWVAVEDATKENGCLWVEPGGHLGPLRELSLVDHGTGDTQLKILNEKPWPDENTAVPVEVPAGSVILFSDHLPHYSSHNHSKQSRMAFSMHIAAGTSHWPDHNWLQRSALPPFKMY